MEQSTFCLPPAKMRSIENAVTECIEDLELGDVITTSIREVEDDRMYHVTFQRNDNGNNKVVISAEYSTSIGDLITDEGWEDSVNVNVIERHGISYAMSEILCESLALCIDPDYFDSDSEEEEEDSDDETLSIGSQPLTPPPSRVRRG